MSALQDCSKLNRSVPMAGVVLPAAQAELVAYYKPWTDFAAGIGPDPGIMPPDGTVAALAIYPISMQTSDGTWTCVDETSVSSSDQQTILAMANAYQMSANVGYLAKVPNPPQLQYWICDDGRRVARSASPGIDPGLARCVDCGKTAQQCGASGAAVQPGDSPSTSPAVTLGLVAAGLIGVYLVFR